MRRKLRLGLVALNATKLSKKADIVISKMTGNASFPSPTPSLADLTTANEALKAAETAASGGDRNAIMIRNDQQLVVANMMRTLAAYISMEANGDGALITSTGFELQRLPEPLPSITRPIDFLTNRGNHTGEVELTWKSVKGAQSYLVEMTLTDPSEKAMWTTVAITSRVKTKLENLEIGKFFYFRVKAIGRSSESSWSDISMVMTAA